MWKRPSGEILALLGALLLALALRLVNIGTEPYWGDEILSLSIARHFDVASEMVRYISEVEFHPPLYYLLLKPWISWFGEAEAATRALSLIFSIGTVVMVWALGRKLFPGTKAGIIAAFVTAILPLQIEYGQEARPYAIFCFFSAAAAFSLLEYLHSRRMLWAAAYIISAAAAMYLHYSAAFGIIALALWWLFVAMKESPERRGRALVEWLLIHALLFVAYFPWLSALLYKLDLGGFSFSEAERNTFPVRQSASFEQAFDMVVWTTKAKYLPQVVVLAGIIFKISLLIAFVSFVAQRNRKFVEGEKQAVIFLVWVATVTATLYLMSPQSIPYTRIVVRHAIFVTVPLALLFGWLMSRINLKHALVISALFVASLIPFVSDITMDDSLWDYDHRMREAGEYVAARLAPGDAVIVPASMVRTDFGYYLPAGTPIDSILPIPFYGNDVWNTHETLGIAENESQVRVRRGTEEEIQKKIARLIERRNAQRVWLFDFVEDDRAVYKWFEDNGWRHSFRSIGDLLRLDLFVRP